MSVACGSGVVLMAAVIPSQILIFLPLIGAAIPLIVTQVSMDKELRAVGRSVMMYAIAFPLVLVISIIGLVNIIV